VGRKKLENQIYTTFSRFLKKEGMQGGSSFLGMCRLDHILCVLTEGQ
jgi:hypothetical protein